MKIFTEKSDNKVLKNSIKHWLFYSVDNEVLYLVTHKEMEKNCVQKHTTLHVQLLSGDLKQTKKSARIPREHTAPGCTAL